MQTRETQLQHMLAQIRTRLLLMGASVQIALDEACTALENGSLGKAQAVREGDEAVNRLEDEIDEMILNFLARYQPVAQDLRFTVAALRIVGELERIGDEAVSIAERVVILHGRAPQDVQDAVSPLMNHARMLFRTAMEAFQNSDTEKAMSLCCGENESTRFEVAALHAIVDHLHTASASDAPDAAEAAMHGILICRAFNRICRRAANIAEQTCFIVQGVNMKHRKDGERRVENGGIEV